MNRGSRLPSTILTCSAICIASVAAAETTVGRWCDQMIPGSNSMNRVITIEVEANGTLISRSEFFDGSELAQQLSENEDRVFRVVGSPSGDKYRLVVATGELQLLDDDGIIRTARRLENAPQPNDCIR